MSRCLAEWVGKTDDSHIPDRVRLRVWERCRGLCGICGCAIRPGGKPWTLEHVIALINWTTTAEKPHGNRESNLGVTCGNCVAGKNTADVAEKSAIATIRKKHVLPKPLSRWGAGRGSKFKKKMSGEVVLR